MNKDFLPDWLPAVLVRDVRQLLRSPKYLVLRKAVIVVPLTLLLPRLGLGASGVFLAEPISNAVGGLACFITMYLTVYKKLGKTQ